MTADQLSLDDWQVQLDASADPTETVLIDRAIREVASWGRPFTANDVRPLLPQLSSSGRIGRRFQVLNRQGVIRHTRTYLPSTDDGTHGHPIAVWVVA